MGHGAVKVDPAIERFNTMREEAYLHFRWTKRTVRTGLLGFVIVPGALYYLSTQYYQHWDFLGKRKGEAIAGPSQPQTQS
ncbi:hypothetical protein D9619_005726 [Psilocybe cf. subviscida]|uniref:Complex I-B15 n=1 Tax=Psilocybe cf. subviscida TaxID=2480587 RepID=A0A8H5BWV1_9AGAR|nr:hypothetical protein D9619_005726 [Psilocybe cf. subviscida]